MNVEVVVDPIVDVAEIDVGTLVIVSGIPVVEREIVTNAIRIPVILGSLSWITFIEISTTLLSHRCCLLQ